jgi:hypothetical protein
MQQLGLFIFQAICWLLYAALAIYLVSEYGWIMLLMFVVQFALLLMVQTQVTAQRNAIAELKSDVALLKANQTKS